MSSLVVENLRLKELLLVVELNKSFYGEFVSFLESYEYENIRAFIAECDAEKIQRILNDYFEKDFRSCLYDGIGRAYPQATSKWYFITWLLRDAATQRLAPIVSKTNGRNITVTPKEVKLNDETYDIELLGNNQKILMPVKTRETMGGGHALLFTRDIHKAISVAEENGFNCIPVVIAESWGGNLEELNWRRSWKV